VTLLLELAGVQAHYGPVQALRDVSLTVEEGEIVAVLGANGAGKTTTLRAVSGTVRRSGELRFAGKRLPAGPEGVARAGIAHVPEGRGTFTELSVMENLRLGAYTRRDRQVKADVARVAAYFPWLERRAGQSAGTLSGGEQQMLALARALMARPRLLLLDEPSLGLAPIVVGEIAEALQRIAADGTAILLADQSTTLALRATDHAHLLESGCARMSGPTDDLLLDDAVRASYLGTAGGHELVEEEAA
jgi:branched-chain amino acid transport system ATP-binding protein